LIAATRAEFGDTAVADLEATREATPKATRAMPWAGHVLLLLALVAGGIWLRVRSQRVPQPQQARVVPTPAPREEEKPQPIVPQPRAPEKQVAVNRTPRHKPVTPALSKQEREEGLVAKEQLMMALRLTTEKLSLVHRKTQNPTPASQIKNQHRVG